MSSSMGTLAPIEEVLTFFLDGYRTAGLTSHARFSAEK
jgi:hypothetical protein